MVGRDLSYGFSRQETTRDEVVLDVRNLSSRWHRDISFQIRAGEILGFAGLVGAGRTELAKVIFGEYHRRTGEISIAGQRAHIRSPSDAIRLRSAMAILEHSYRGLELIDFEARLEALEDNAARYD